MNAHTAKVFNKKQQEKYAARTGIVVDIQNIGKNTDLIAIREKKSLKQLRPGVFLKTDILELKSNFCNVYDLFWNQKQANITPFIQSSSTPYFLLDKIQNDPSTIAIINGSFFFITDEADREPVDLPYDLCIRDGKVIGLPASNQPVAIIQDGKLQARELKATGTMLIGKKQITWIGAQCERSALRSSRKNNTKTAVLYNSKCSNIIKFRDPKTNIQIGVLDNKHITTPTGVRVFDLIVGIDQKGVLKVTNIRLHGKTHFYDGNFILQIKGNAKDYHIGDIVTPVSLDFLDLSKISSAITIGKSVHDTYFLEPERRHKRDARSLLAEDSNGYLHLFVFDGSKYVPGFNGVSAQDIAPFFSPEKFKWAYFLDGGGSSRLLARDNSKLRILANEFIVQKLPNGKFLWDWERARLVASSISLRVKGN